MSKKENLLLEYFYNRLIFLENEVKQIQENVRYRRIDSIDCLELIIACERLQMFIEVSKDVTEILKLHKGIPP